MCCSIRRERVKEFVRNHPNLPVEYQGKSGKAQLSGFSQMEKIGYWREQGDAVNVNILADSFVEGDVEVKVPTGRIAALGLRREIKINGTIIGNAKSVRILTREARNKWESSKHNRWPLVYNGTDIYEFGEKDCISNQTNFDF